MKEYVYCSLMLDRYIWVPTKPKPTICLQNILKIYKNALTILIKPIKCRKLWPSDRKSRGYL